jgi:hypothetical protein
MDHKAGRKLVGEAQLPLGGRVIIEADEGGTYVAWRTHDGGRAEACFDRLQDGQVERALAVFREEGATVALQDPAMVRQRLVTALDPQGTLDLLLCVHG